MKFFLFIPVPIPDEEKKLTWVFIFTLLCGVSKGLLKAFKEPFEAPKRSVKIKIKVTFYLNIIFWNARGEKGYQLWD